MKGWAELKEAFWAAVERGPDEQARRAESLASIDPALPARLAALLNADSAENLLARLFETPADPPVPPERNGPYDVVGVLGAGGMGEVYRARDPRLQRDVAIKVLPAVVTNDPEWLARLRREAQVLAALNHPHIAHVYGLEESSGVPALVMELVTGPTLSAVIAPESTARPGIPAALKLARQISDALDAAHDRGIVHRDLKPGNVVLTEDGDVKIIDFGLAKSIGLSAPNDAPGPSAAGVVLGTPAYMSPEQARGLPVDKRTDIWAFGCVLYELLTGRQAFAGDTASDSLAAVLERDPDMTLLPAAVPDGIRAVVRHCLEKDPKRRLRDIADARLAIDDVLTRPYEETDRSPIRLPSVRSFLPAPVAWAVAAVALAIAAVTFERGRQPENPSGAQAQRAIASIVLPPGMRLADADVRNQGSESRFAISPDGRQLALIASDGTGPARLWLRALGSTVLQPLARTEGASSPFWSPDSGSIAFIASDRLKVIRLSDGTLTTANETGFRLGAWSSGDRILFAPQPRSPLYVTSPSGGALAAATILDETNGEVQHGAPAFLPDGRHFLFFSLGSKAGGMLDPGGIYVGSLDDPRARQLLIAGATVARYASGHILFVKNGTLMAQPFDAERRTFAGAPAPIVEDVKAPASGATGGANFTVSDNGVLAYQSGMKTESRPLWLDRDGQQLTAIAPPGDYGDIALSPDGTRLAVSALDPAASTRDLWVYDVTGGGGRRVTFDPGDEFAPVWSPDGTRLLFSSMARSLVNLQMKDVTGTADPVVVKVDDLGLGRFAADWSKDGRYLFYVAGGRIISRSDLWVAPVAQPNEAHPLVDSTFVETHVRLSPDGRWFAYTSNETGRFEVYVDRFPDRGAKRMVSSAGGGWPRWSSDGHELFYLAADNHLMTLPITPAPDRFLPGAPRPLFLLRTRLPDRLDAYAYDVSPDGRRFVVNTLIAETDSTTITVVFNWTSGLPRR